MNPPVLMTPMPEQPFILYMTVLDESMGCMLGQHDDSGKREQVVYYLSKKFTAYEMNYSLLERTCCALVWASHRLRKYMLSHTLGWYPRWTQSSKFLRNPLLEDGSLDGRFYYLSLTLSMSLKR